MDIAMKLGEWLSRRITGYPWIERVQAAQVRAGDVLVVSVPKETRRSDLEAIRRQLEDVMPDGVRGVLMAGDIRIDVIHTVDPSTRPLAGVPFSREGDGQ